MEALKLYAQSEPLPVEVARALASEGPPLAAAQLGVFLAGYRAGLSQREATTPASAAPVLDAEALGELLGITASYVRRLRKAGKLPPALDLEAGGVKWARSHVLKWVDWGCPDIETFKQKMELEV